VGTYLDMARQAIGLLAASSQMAADGVDRPSGGNVVCRLGTAGPTATTAWVGNRPTCLSPTDGGRATILTTCPNLVRLPEVRFTGKLARHPRARAVRVCEGDTLAKAIRFLEYAEKIRSREAVNAHLRIETRRDPGAHR